MQTQTFRLGVSLTLFALLVLFPSPAPASESDQNERPNFSGTWQLNEEMSENPREKMGEAMRSRRGGMGGGRMGGGPRGGGMGGGPRGGGMGGGPMGGGMGGGPKGGGMGEMRERMQALEERIKLLEIRHDDPVLAVRYDSDDSDSEQPICTDGRSFSMENQMGEVVEAKAKWKKNQRIVVTMEREQGGKVTETYELVPVAQVERLFVTVKLTGDGRMPTVEFRRVYDRVENEEALATE